MSNCEEVTKELHEYLDRELSLEEAEQVDRHLQRCPSCYQLVMFESGVIKLVRRDCSTVSAPEHLKSRLRAIVRS